ncbi:restriction endonuclease subunit S [Bacillus sp. GMs2/2]|uniref:restriction endonuclease subunit S n=1 Tax=Bacillus sp. GMs2/2 TaxID=3418494 RepID=UPI003CF3951F
MNEPKLRFKEFSGEWDLVELNTLTTEIKAGRSKITEGEKSYPILGSTGIIGYTNTYDYEGDFILVARVGANAGKITSFEGKCKITDNTIFFESIHAEKIFIQELLIKNNLSKKSFGSGQPLIKGSDLKKLKVYIPSLSEQLKLKLFLKNINKKIQLEQQKINLLQEQKKGYMQKIFKQGIRFKGFNEEWKQWKLGELAEVRTGKAFSSADFNDNGEYLVITNKNIQDEANGITSVGDRIDIHDDTILNNYLLSGDNILVTMDGVNIGKTGKYSNEKAVLAQRVGRLNSEQIDFVYQITSSNKFVSEMNKLSVGNAIKHISLKHISDYSFSAPTSKREQEKIGSFFKKIDRKIQLLQQKIDLLHEQKKGFMQQMFV